MSLKLAVETLKPSIALFPAGSDLSTADVLGHTILYRWGGGVLCPVAC